MISSITITSYSSALDLRNSFFTILGDIIWPDWCFCFKDTDLGWQWGRFFHILGWWWFRYGSNTFAAGMQSWAQWYCWFSLQSVPISRRNQSNGKDIELVHSSFIFLLPYLIYRFRKNKTTYFFSSDYICWFHHHKQNCIILSAFNSVGCVMIYWCSCGN